MGARQETEGMKGKLRVGIAGFGAVGTLRQRVVNERDDMQVVAVCDQRFTGSGRLPDGTAFHPDYHGLLNGPLDVLFVSLPNYLAPEVTIAGLERGLHVFCEKPPGKDVTDVVRVIECERRHPGLKLMYGFNHRYHDSVRDALRIVQGGELGKVVNLRGVYGKSKMIRFDSDWRTRRELAGGGILLDQGIHMVDMLRLFAGEFTEIWSVVSNGYWHHDVEDNAYALMKTADGVVAMLHSSATQWRHRFHLDITLERGMISLAGILSSSKSYGAETITVAYSDANGSGDPKEQMTRYNDDHSWRDEVEAFAASIEHGTPIVSGSSAEALKTMHLVYRIYCADPEWRQRYKLEAAVPAGVL
jgi:predicted dehydrogenase